MDKFEYNVAVWYEKDTNEWFYSVIQECNGETESLLYGTHFDPKVAIQAITDCLRELEF